ncbi:MAG: HEPN domain-containing protein [Anaerolineales bacterium]|nr:MAG: HEPN domain-containing protein [Anaerolineales bacterium]
MKDYSSKLFSKALDAIEAAEALLNINKAEFAAGRAYYAMFYVAEALLYNEFDLKFSRARSGHCGVWKEFCENQSARPKISPLDA